MDYNYKYDIIQQQSNICPYLDMELYHNEVIMKDVYIVYYWRISNMTPFVLFTIADVKFKIFYI